MTRAARRLFLRRGASERRRRVVCAPDGPDLLTIDSVWAEKGAVLILHATPEVDHVLFDTPTGSKPIATHGSELGYPATGIHAPDEPTLRGELVPISSTGEALSEPVPILVRGLDQAATRTHPSQTMIQVVEATEGASYLGGDNPGIATVELLFRLGGDTYELFAVPAGTNVAYLDLADPTRSVEIDGSRIDMHQREDDTIEAVFDRIGLTVGSNRQRAHKLTCSGQ